MLSYQTALLTREYFSEQEKRKAEMTNDTEQSETKRVRIPIDIPLNCITNPSPTPSDIDLLARLFPSEQRFLLEMILQGCYGNILHAIQVIARSSTSSGVGPSPTPMPSTTLPSTTSTDSPLLNFGASFINNTYRYLYPGYVTPPSYLYPGASGMGYFRPYFPKIPSTSSPMQINGSSSSASVGNGDESTKATYNGKEYNSLNMTPSPSPKREEAEHLCLKCNHKQKNGKICEQCGQNSNIIVNMNQADNL